MMASFLNKVVTDRTLIIGMSSYEDLCVNLHLAGVYDTDFMRAPVLKLGRFYHFMDGTRFPLVSVILVDHCCDKLKVLSDTHIRYPLSGLRSPG